MEPLIPLTDAPPDPITEIARLLVEHADEALHASTSNPQ
jgi:hypothetical protein